MSDTNMWRSNTLWPQDNYTALHLAVESGKSSVVEALLGHGAQVTMKKMIKGEVKQSFYWLKLREVSTGNIQRKAPKTVKNQAKWSKIDQEPSDIRPAEGIHQFCHPTYRGNPLVDNFSIRPAGGIHRFCHRSYWGNPSILSSDLLRESTRV